MKNSLQEIPFWIVAIFLVVFALFFKPFEKFWTDIFANFLGSFLALLIGIPIAIFVNDEFQKRLNSKNLEDSNKKEKELLTLILEELNWNKARLAERIELKNSNSIELSLNRLKSHFFYSLQNSGLLAFIKNPILLNSLVSTYFVIDNLKSIEYHCYKAVHSATVRDTDGISVGEKTLKESYTYYELLGSSISMSISKINERLNELNK